MTSAPSEPRAFDPGAAPPPRKLGGGPPGGKLDRPSFGAARVLMGVLTFVGLLVVLSVIAALFAGESGLRSPAGTVALLVVQSIAFVVAAVTLASPRLDGGGRARLGATLRELGLRRSEGRIASSVIFAVLAYIGASILIAVALAPEQEDVTRALGVEASTAAAIAAGVMIVLVAPVVEELFFRGFLFGGLRRDLPFWAAGAIANAIFGLAHLTGSTNFAVVLQLFVFGLVLSWLYERTNSLRPCIALHAVNNAFAFAALLAT
ncbi:CPBP family intramembrane metalloprotease [Thermoleophilia bacterium SCSIO 60948]|nr:CPBP family intramembrane metalloprotease [Thermoleophilia bacterium SCSIO 60948]